MADVVNAKALALVIQIAPVGFRVPSVAATKMESGKPPCTECGPMMKNRTAVEDQRNKAELGLEKN